jgi:outer membrane murein-binding lipoprotein Lpp
MTRARVLAPAAVVLALVGLAGCASNGDVEALRSEIAGVRAIAQSADQKATMAAADAQKAAADAAQAAEDARIAGEKSDRIFREGLRK